MAKVVNMFGLPKTQGMFGLEVECEGNNLPYLEAGLGPWVSVDDGSLRGVFPKTRCEYILNNPLNYDKAIESIEVLGETFKNNNSILNYSFRTSVHVHVNVQDLDEVQVLNFIYLYLLYEESLVDFCGEGRKANRFCLRLQDADGLSEVLHHIFTRGLFGIKEFREDNIRYSSINLWPLVKYGSLEFRAMKGTHDPELLIPWLTALKELREKATKPNTTPALIRKELIERGVNGFTEEVFSKETIDKVLSRNFEDHVNLAHSLTLDLPFMFEKSPYIKKGKEKRAIEGLRANFIINDDIRMDELVMPVREGGLL